VCEEERKMLGEYTMDWTIYHFIGLVAAIVFIPTAYGVISSAAIKNDKEGQEYYKEEGWSGKRIFSLLTDILLSFPVAFPVMMTVLVVLIPMAIDYINQHWGMDVVIFLFMGFLCLIPVVIWILQKKGVIDKDEKKNID
jgi:hypothetical protein